MNDEELLEIKKRAKLNMIESNIKYIAKLEHEIRQQHRLLNDYIDEYNLTDDKIDIPLGDLCNDEGYEKLLELFRNKIFRK